MARQLEDELDRHAQKKFGPGDWRATRRGLQQATPWQVAHLKATWLGQQTVFDLCCGIGGDAVAFARRGPIMAVDSDAQLVTLARHNLQQLEHCFDWDVRCADVTKFPIPTGAAVHIDPDRRPNEGRNTRPENYQPSWSEVTRLLSHVRFGVIKVAPAAIVDPTTLPTHHRCWISLQGTVREQSILIGDSVTDAGMRFGCRSAALLDAGGKSRIYCPDIAEERVTCTTEQPGSFLIDPDAAIRAAGLTETFAQEFELSLIDSAAGFLTADSVNGAVSSLAQVGEVWWSGSCDDRRLRKEMRARNVYPQTIKVRGTDHNPKCADKSVPKMR